MIDEASRGASFFRIVISPDRQKEDSSKDLYLSQITEQTMLTLEERLGTHVPFIAVSTTTTRITGAFTSSPVSKVSIGTEAGPPIGMQKEPRRRVRGALVRVANRRDPRATWSAPRSSGTACAGGCLFAHLGKLRVSVTRGS